MNKFCIGDICTYTETIGGTHLIHLIMEVHDNKYLLFYGYKKEYYGIDLIDRELVLLTGIFRLEE